MLLTIQALYSYYGNSQILKSAALAVAEGEVVALVGRNGAGKSTLLKSIMGLVDKRRGTLDFMGRDLKKLYSYEISRLGVGYVPEGRGIFGKLTVQENIEISVRKSSAYPVRQLFRLFPQLVERRKNWGFQLSGGEQQMLAIARALATGPRLILLDEPSQGLAPVIVESVVEMIKKLKKEGIAVLLVEQNVQVCADIADRFYIIDSGRTVYESDNETFMRADDIRRRYLTLDIAQ
jgi:branched-chain amino acid transport system ATP-binding protein